MSKRPTLGDLIETVGVLDVLVAPLGLDVAVGAAVIHDPEEGWVGGRHDVILAVGVNAARASAPALADKAGDVGAAALVVKVRESGGLDGLVEAARNAGVAVLAAPPELAWEQLHALVRTAVTATGGGEAEGGVPIGDLFALANAVAASMGGPVTIEDPRSTVLAYSNLADHEVDEGRRATILGHRVPDEWIERQQDDGIFRKLFREHGVVRHHYAEFGLKPRMAIAIRAGDEILGTIWVQEGDRAFDDQSEEALTEAARIAALHLLRHRSSADLERGRRTELLRAALEGRVAPDALASVLQLRANTPLTVVAVELLANDQGDDAAAMAVRAERAASMITLYCESYRRQAAVVAIGAVIYVLVPKDGVSERERMPAFASAIRTQVAEALKVDARVGIGATVETIEKLLPSRQEADRVLRALAAGDAGNVATAEDVRSQIVMQLLEELAVTEPALRAGKLERLVENDRKRSTEYLTSLRAFFDALGDMPAAAAALGVHPNTFRYRMRRLAETADIDLDDPVERLVLQLQLRFLHE